MTIAGAEKGLENMVVDGGCERDLPTAVTIACATPVAAQPSAMGSMVPASAVARPAPVSASPLSRPTG